MFFKMDITKPCLQRICRKAGVKSIGEDSYHYLRALMEQRLEQVIVNSMKILAGQSSKSLSVDDL